MTNAEPQKQPPVVNRSAPKATVAPILIYATWQRRFLGSMEHSGLSSVCELRYPMAQ
jgi:hypothetical protein